MPGRDVDDAGEAELPTGDERAQGVATPGVQGIVTAGAELPLGDPVDVMFLGSVIIFAGEKR